MLISDLEVGFYMDEVMAEQQTAEAMAAPVDQVPIGRDDAMVLTGSALKEGQKKHAIVTELEKRGMVKETAKLLVDEVMVSILRAETFTPISVVTATIAGVCAAAIGGYLWSLIVSLTDIEIGYMATGIGFLCGFAVVMLSLGKRGIPFQLIAVITSLMGIFVGKFLLVHGYFIQDATESAGAEFAAQFPMFSPAFLEIFFANISKIISGYDFLWVILAVVVAWQLPARSKIYMEP